MRFDDRLRTALAQPASDPHDRAVRWRQLVELVGRSGSESDPALIDRALAEIRESAGEVDERVRSASALSIARLPLPAGLVAAFAADTIAVAAPILASARLTASEWKSVAAAASGDCRAFIATMQSQSGQAEAKPEPEVGREPPGPVPSIGEVVARIERVRQQREANSGEARTAADNGEAPRLFKWECNEAGEIDWVDGAPRGALVGQSIASKGVGAGVDPNVERAFAARAPFHEGVLELPDVGQLGGTWKISGVPAFERGSGRFAGYRGVAERACEHSGAGPLPVVDPNSLRELAHEIKTPLNAIIGFAEIIAGEYFGPAETRCRERAAEIVAQARLLLAAIEDLDFAAKLRSSDRTAECDLADCLASSWEEIERRAEMRGVRVNVEAGDKPVRCRLDPQLTQRLVERLCLALIGSAASGETLTFRLASDKDNCVISVNRPASLNSMDFTPERNRRSSDAPSLPLRLVLGLARAAGGDLVGTNGDIALRLPGA